MILLLHYRCEHLPERVQRDCATKSFRIVDAFHLRKTLGNQSSFIFDDPTLESRLVKRMHL